MNEEIKEEIKEIQSLSVTEKNNEILKKENVEVTNEIKQKEEEVHQLEKEKN